jgi:hypothetical protein
VFRILLNWGWERSEREKERERAEPGETFFSNVCEAKLIRALFDLPLYVKINLGMSLTCFSMQDEFLTLGSS